MLVEREATRGRNVKHNVSAIRGYIGNSHKRVRNEGGKALKAKAQIALVVSQFTSK